jgi:hypothetical protein
MDGAPSAAERKGAVPVGAQKLYSQNGCWWLIVTPGRLLVNERFNKADSFGLLQE